MIINNSIKIDLEQKGYGPVVYAVQGDINTRTVTVELMEGGQPWAVPAGVTPSLAYMQLLSGGSGWYDTLPDGEAACTIEGNTVTAVLVPQLMDGVGTVAAAIVFQDGELNQLSTFRFQLLLEPNPAADNSIGNEYYNLMTLGQINDAVAAVNQRVALVESFLAEGSLSGLAFDGGYVDEAGYLKLTRNDVELGTDVYEPIYIGSGGGSGGGSAAVMKLQNLSDALIFAVVKGQSCPIRFRWSSVDDTGASTGPGMVQYIVNGITKSTIPQVPQGEVSGDVSAWLESGVNSVQVKVTDSYGVSRTLNYSIQAVALSISSTFDYVTPVTGALEFRFVASGAADKTIHFELDGTELETMIVASSGKQSGYTIPAQSHGAHILRVWASATVDSLAVTSNELRYAVIWLEEGNTTPVIASAFDLTKAEEGDTLAIPYVVYDPASETSTITLEVDGTVAANLTVGRGEQVWNTRASTVGDMEFVIRCGDVEKAFPVAVSALDIDVSVAQSDLRLELSAEGRSNAETTGRDQWKSGDVAAELTGFNWRSNGWIAGDDGRTVLRVDGGAGVYIPCTPFDTDARATGRTIELDFATRAVQAAGSEVISCLQGNVGFSVGDQSAMIRSEAMPSSVKFKEEERIHLTFCIEPSAQDRLIRVYIDGILSGVSRYPDTDNIQQGSPVGISIGSASCGVDIGVIRVYDACLSDREVLENYLAGLNTAAKKAAYMDNSILNEDGEAAMNAVMERLPVMVITGELPQTKGDKKTVTVSYVNRTDSSKNFTMEGVSIDVQGTSSAGYPRKNYKIKLPTEYEHITGHIPEKTFTLKADYMESSGRHNTQMANLIGSLYDEPVPPQEDDPRVRTTIAGFPFALFQAAQEGQTPVFIGKYNFNNDKGNSDTLGLTNPNLHQRWEVCNNISARCLFLDPDFSHGDITADFEASYPDADDVTPDYAALQMLSQWIYDTKDDPDRFKAEAAAHFNLHYLLMYSVITELLGMMDSRTKNMFLATWDREIWYPEFYDLDTCLGLDNEGHNTFSYDMEWIDGVWNGSTNALWNSVETAFAAERAALYRSLRSSGKLTFEKVLDALDGNHAHVSETLYNEDAAFKYVGPLIESGTDYLYAAQGSRESHRAWWLYNRFKYLDSKYDASDYAADMITMRLYTEDGVIPSSGTFEITPYADGYKAVRYGANGREVKERSRAGEPVTISAPLEADGSEMVFGDTETFIFDAGRISSLGDLANKYADTVDVSKAVRLKELILGSGVEGYENPNLKSVTLANNRLLEKLDVRGCSALSGSVDMTGCENIRWVYAQGSAITSVALPVGGRLEALYLPATVTGLIIRDHPSLRTLEIAGCENLSTVRLENAGTIDSYAIVRDAANLVRLRALDVNWAGVSAAVLDRLLNVDGLDSLGGNIANAVITGKVQVEAASQRQIDAWQAAWPKLELTVSTVYEEHTVTFVGYDGTVLDQQLVVKYESAVNPITSGRIEVPTKPSDDVYDYTFTGWDRSFETIEGDTVITAQFSSSYRYFTVRWINGDRVLQTDSVRYGLGASYTGSMPVRNGSLFGGWSANPDVVTSDMDIYAVFDAITVPEAVKTLEECSWAEILGLARQGYRNDDGQWCYAREGVEEIWFDIGDTKTMIFGEETITLRLEDFNHDVDETGAEIPFTFICNDIAATMVSSIWPSCWPTAEIRTFLQTELYALLPIQVQQAIKAADKSTYTPDTEADPDNTLHSLDTLWCPSLMEAGFSSAYFSDIGNYVPVEGTDGNAYPLWVDSVSRMRYLAGTSTAVTYHLRCGRTSGQYLVVAYKTGGQQHTGAYQPPWYFCFGFCVG